MASGSMSRIAGTSMPISRARVIIANSFSGTPSNSREGSLTIHDPPTPRTGIVSPPLAASTAENFNWTPASENRSAFPRP